MHYRTLISVTDLYPHINDNDWIILDCRFSLINSATGAYAYRHGHISNARYVHLDNDLSSAITAQTGRHPLPNFNALVKKLAAWGISNYSQVVVYDDVGGAFAGRLWWLLRTLGHDNVAVLDGGIQHWQKLYSITTHLPRMKAANFRSYLNNYAWLTARQVEDGIARKTIMLIDARTPERYRGEQEPIDPVAGHIPYALNRPLQRNLTALGLFLSPAELRAQFKQLIGNTAPEQVIHYCGSGVTACHNLLAMEHAGLQGSKLYAGSWSEWIRNKNRCVIRGYS
jgi:thiosulfate/3-mercaptopyruvate sulfurtransferase